MTTSWKTPLSRSDHLTDLLNFLFSLLSCFFTGRNDYFLNHFWGWRQIYGALWLTSKSFLMDHSKIDIVSGSDDWMVATSTVEASNIAYIGVSIYSLRNYESKARYRVWV
jgi:hypothetical protein